MADNSERTREEDQKAGQSLEQLAKTIESKSFFTVLNPKLNEVVFNYGNFGDLTKTDSPGGNGIVHIIQRRNDKDGLSSVDIASLLLKIKEIAETEPPDSFDKTESRAFINKDGIRVILQKNWGEYEKNWLVSGYGLVDKSGRMTSEATETIQAVTARYGYKPEHSFLREQVGAVIASIPTIRQKQQEVKDLKSRTKIEKGTKIISTSNPKTVYDRATLKSAPRNSSDKELISAYVAMSYARNALENGNKSELFKHTKAKKLLEKSVNETLIKEIEGELRARGYTLHINNSINESSMNYERVVVMDVSAGKEKENSGFGLKKALPPNERQVVEEVKENPIELPKNNKTQAPESVSNNPAPKTAVLFGKNVYEYEHDGYAARICHGVKEGDYEAKRTMARFLASQIKEPTVLLPCPQHTGEAEYTLEIAEMILEELGPNMVNICNTLVCDPHETMYEQKRALTEGATRPLSAEQISSLDAGNMRWRENAAQIFGKYIHWKHCLLDNVISTGRTLSEARKLVPDIEPLVFAASKIYLEKNIKKENKLMKKTDMTHGEVVIVRRPHQRPSTVTMFGSFKEALDAYSSDYTLMEYKNVEDYISNSGFDPENDSEQIEETKKRILDAGIKDGEPFVEFGIGNSGNLEFYTKKDFGEKEALEATAADDMYAGQVFYAEEGETYGQFAERVYDATRGHNAPDRSSIMDAMSIEPRQLKTLYIDEYLNQHLPEEMAPFSDEQIQELVKWGGEYIDDELYYDPETDEAFRVWSSDDWELDHDESVLNKSGVADILFHAALRVQDDIDFLSVEQEHGEYLVKIDGERKLKDFYMNKYREVRAHEFADLRQVYCFEEETHGFTSDKMQHLFRFLLNDSNTDALGLKSSNDIYYNLRVQTNIEGHIEDMFIEKRNGDNDLIEGDIALDDDQSVIFDKARNVVEDYIHTSFPEIFPYTVNYAFPETKEYMELSESGATVPKKITTYEEPRWNFSDEKELLSIIKEADENLYNEIQDAMKKNPDDKFFIDLGKSLRYDDTLLWGMDYSKESLSDKLSNEFDVRYGNEDGSVCNYDDVSTIAIKNEKLAEKLNSMVRNHVDENIRAFAAFKEYRDKVVQKWLGATNALSHATIEVPGEEKKFIVDADVIPTGIKELLSFPNVWHLGSDRQYHDIEYFISRSYKVRDGKPDLTSGETFLTEKIFVDDGAEGIWEIKEENPLKRYYFGEDTVRLLEDSLDKYTAEKTKQPLVTTSVSLEDFEDCDVCIHKVAASDQTKTWQLHVSPQKEGLQTTTLDLKAVEETELDDLWVGFKYGGKEFDLNIYKDGDGKRKAAVYAVEDGKTNQEKSVSASDFHVIDYDRLNKIFSGIQSDAGSGSLKTFRELREWVENEYPDEREYWQLLKTTVCMIEGFADFEGVKPSDLDALGFDDNHDEINNIADPVAEKVLAGELTSVKEIQDSVSEMAKARRKEIVLDKMMSGLSHAYDGIPAGKHIRIYADVDAGKFGLPEQVRDRKLLDGDYRLVLELNENGKIADRAVEFVTNEGDVLYDQQVKQAGEFYNAFWSDDFNDKALEWFREQRSMENIFLDIDKHNIRKAGEKKGFFTWDELYKLALETGPMDRELKAKDNARWYVANKAEEFGIDIEGAEIPEDAIDDFLKEHPEFDRFNEDGQMIEEEKVIERHYDAEEYDLADKDDLMNLGERYGITEEIADEIYRFYNLTADSEDFELLTDPDAKFVVHEFNPDSTQAVSLPELIFEAKERLLIEKAQEEHPWRDTSVTKLVDEDWYYYMAHKELFSDPSKFTADENGEPSPEDIDIARDKYRESEIERIESQGSNFSVCTGTNFNCTFTLDLSEQRDSESLEKIANEIRQNTYDKIKAKYGFNDANTNTELFLDKEHPENSSYFIGFALVVPEEYSYPPEKTEEFEKKISKELEDEFGAYVNWEGGERVKEVFKNRNDAQDYINKVYWKKEMDNKNTLAKNPDRNERYISKRIVGSYTPLDVKDVRKVFVINGFRDSIGGLGDELYEAIKDEMESAWSEEFVSRNSDGMVYWHDKVGEEGSEFAQVDMEKCEKILRNCISTIKDATQGRDDQNQFLEPLEQLLKEHEERTREEQLDVAWSEGRMRELFDGMTSSLGSGNQMTFDEMKEWVKEEFPERNDKAVLQDTVSRMLYDNVDFADFEVTEYDDKYRLGDGGDYRWSLAEDAAKKLIYGEIYTIEQVQEAVTARSHEMKKDLLEKSDDRYMMMTTDRIHAAGEIIMAKYEDYPELKSFYEQYYEKKANKTLGMGELCEEKLKEIAEHYNNGEGLVTMETQNDDTETVEITYTPSEIEALIKGRDAYLVGEESLDFIRPNAEQLKKGFEEHISKFDNIARGSWISTGQEVVPDAECIEQIDSMNVFASDSKAAEQWARDTGGKLLVEGKDIFLSGLNGCVTFIDTTKNRGILKDYLLDKPLEQKFDWSGFSEERFNELKKDILSGRLGDNYDASVKDYRGTVNIGNIAVDITFREQGRTSLDYDFYILGQKGEGERHGVPYDYESGETFDLIGIRDNDYETFKKFFENEVTNTIAKREDLLKEAVQPTIDWNDEKAVKDLYSKKLGEQLAKEFATLDFKPDTWNELIEKGADPREALAVAAEDANLGDNLNWLLDKIGDDKLKEYFSDREFAGRVFDAAKESMTHDLSNSLSDIGDREGFRAFPAFYTGAITRLAEITGKTVELLSYGDDLLIKEGKAVRVEPYTRDEKAMQAVRNALARMEGYGDENEIGTDKVTAFIDNIGNENNHMVIGLGNAAGYMNWYDKTHNGMEYEIPEILAQIESWAEGHAAVAEPDSEQARDYGYIQELRKYHPIQNNEIWKRLEEQFRNVRTFHLDFSGDFSETKKEVLDYYVDSNTDYDEEKWQEDTVYRLLEENINFGTLSETKDELDSPDHSEKMEQRSAILEKLSERIVAGEITIEQAQSEADKQVYGFKFDWSGFTEDDFRKLKEDIERGKVVEGNNYGSVHAGSISIDLCWRDNPEQGPLLDIDFYTLGEKGIGGQIELKDGTEVPYSEYFAGQIGFDSVEKYSYEEFKKAYEDVLVDLLAHGEDMEHYIREAQRPLVDWNNEEQVRVLMDEKIKESKSLSFSDDLDKIRDFDSLTKEEFLDSYSYITEQQYDATARELSLKGVSGKEQTREIESGIASKVLQNVREHWNWGGNAVFDEARAWNPEEYGIESEDDHKVHVLVQFHDNHGKGSCPSEEDFSDKVNNHWLIQDLHADGVEVIGLNTEISGTIDQYLSKLKENLKNGISFSYIGIDSEKTSELETIISEKPVVGFKLFLEDKSDLRKLFEDPDSGQKLMPGDEVSILANYDTEGLESLTAILVTENGNGDSINLLTTNLLDDKDKIRIKDVVNNEINLYLERNKDGMSVREAYFTEPKPVKVFRNGQDLADFMNETNRERNDPGIYDEQAAEILYVLDNSHSSVYADEKGNGYLLDVSENFDGMGARASNKDIVELALESADKLKLVGYETKRHIRELYEEFNKEKNPIELADEIAAEKEKEIVPELFKKELLSLMRSEKLTVKDPFIATKVILDVWKKEKPQSVQYLNEYLKKSGCTSKEGFEKFFKDEVGLRKKEPAHEFHLKKAAHKRESDGREGR